MSECYTAQCGIAVIGLTGEYNFTKQYPMIYIALAVMLDILNLPAATRILASVSSPLQDAP